MQIMRVLSFVVAALFAVVPATVLAQVKAAVIFQVPNPGSVNGWERGHMEGVKLLQKAGWNVTVAENVPFPRLAETASGYANSGFDVVIFTSSGNIAAWNEVSPKHPKTLFVLMSSVGKLPDSKNVMAYSMDFYAYGAVAGAAAALSSKTGKIAAIGGVPVPALAQMFSAVIEGAKTVRPNTEVFVAFSGDWVNVPRAREVAALQIQRGADIIIANAGNGTRGIIDAAEGSKVHTVGYATDWYEDAKNVFMTSIVMNIPQWYAAFLKDYQSKNLTPRITRFGADSFSVADFRGKLNAQQEAQLRETVRKLQKGEINVPVKTHEFK